MSLNSPIIEKCQNCGSDIGAMETPMVWNDSVVCRICYNRLKGSEQILVRQDSVLMRSENIPGGNSSAISNYKVQSRDSKEHGKSTFPANVLTGYIHEVGKRSFTYQKILLVWTIIMFWMAVILFSRLSVANSPWVFTEAQLAALPPIQRAQILEQRRSEADDSVRAERRAERGWAALPSLLCPFSIWGIVALPLLIAAFATAGKKPEVKA